MPKKSKWKTNSIRSHFLAKIVLTLCFSLWPYSLLTDTVETAESFSSPLTPVYFEVKLSDGQMASVTAQATLTNRHPLTGQVMPHQFVAFSGTSVTVDGGYGYANTPPGASSVAKYMKTFESIAAENGASMYSVHGIRITGANEGHEVDIIRPVNPNVKMPDGVRLNSATNIFEIERPDERVRDGLTAWNDDQPRRPKSGQNLNVLDKALSNLQKPGSSKVCSARPAPTVSLPARLQNGASINTNLAAQNRPTGSSSSNMTRIGALAFGSQAFNLAPQQAAEFIGALNGTGNGYGGQNVTPDSRSINGIVQVPQASFAEWLGWRSPASDSKPYTYIREEGVTKKMYMKKDPGSNRWVEDTDTEPL